MEEQLLGNNAGERAPMEVLKASKKTICVKSLAIHDLDAPLLPRDYNGEVADCRVCLQPIEAKDQLLAPCMCTGSVEHICRDCLKQWRDIGASDGDRGYEVKGIRCELCGFAYLYQCERVSHHRRLLITLEWSWRAISLFIFGGFLLATWNLGILLDSTWPFATMLGLAMEMSWDLYISLGQPLMGSSRYSLRRIRNAGEAEAMDSWELHKIEWARAGVVPVEPDKDHAKECKLYMRLMAGWLAFMAWCVCLCGQEKPFHEALHFLMTYVWNPFMSVGLVYLATQVTLHTISAFRIPPLILSKDADGNPLVRSITTEEAQNSTPHQISEKALGA